MKITAITKLKHGDIYLALKSLGWSQSELARQLNVNPTVVGDVINLKRRPGKKLAQNIQNVLGKQGFFIDITELWPESFPGFGKKSLIHEETKDIDPSFSIEEYQKTPLEILEHKEKKELLEHALECAPKRMKKVLELHWLEGKTLNEIGKEMNISTERVRQLECHGFMFIRYGRLLEREIPESTEFIPIFHYERYGEKKNLNNLDD